MDEGKRLKSHGTGLEPWHFKCRGENVVIEHGALVFHSENIELGHGIYIGHQAIIKAYYKNTLKIGSGTWIGQQVFIHSAGGIEIGENVGIGPGVKILTSKHKLTKNQIPIMNEELEFAAVIIEDGCDIGVNATILPGVRIGRGSQVAAGAVVTKSCEPYSVIGGVPAIKLKSRIE
jgi:acetyltransferase-like isoleucine patch superfamily enzyme